MEAVNWTFRLALYGAVVATLTAIAQIWTYARDRSLLRVSMMLGIPYPGPAQDLSLSFSIGNAGRRPITVKMLCGDYGWWWWHENRGSVVLTLEGLPTELSEGGYKTFATQDCLELLDGRRIRFYARDARGKRWWVRSRQVRQAQAAYRNLLAEGEQFPGGRNRD